MFVSTIIFHGYFYKWFRSRCTTESHRVLSSYYMCLRDKKFSVKLCVICGEQTLFLFLNGS
ncbi:hypothetical protein M116_0613 [Bacteroides fragilis str. 3719 A10]|nr:hypothetical protein M116_0613 [Bacteroides fragilis str. 3719 A10]